MPSCHENDLHDTPFNWSSNVLTPDAQNLPRTHQLDVDLATRSWFFILWFSLLFWCFGKLASSSLPRRFMSLLRVPSHDPRCLPPDEPPITIYLVASGTASPWVAAPLQDNAAEYLLRIRGAGDPALRRRNGGIYALSASLLYGILLEILRFKHQPLPQRLTGLQYPSILGPRLLAQLTSGPTPPLTFKLGRRVYQPLIQPLLSPENPFFGSEEDELEEDLWR